MSATQETLPLAESRPAVFLNDGAPIVVIAKCKEAAIKANWSLRAWDEFSVTARACLQASCTPEEFALFLRVVEQRFTVTRGPRFDPDPTTWAPHRHADID